MLLLVWVGNVLRGLRWKTLLLALLLNLVLQMRRQEADLLRRRRRRVEGGGSPHQRMVGAVVLKGRKEGRSNNQCS